ncbi:efflux RND transporter periplasmic adaptor subunit [Vibrio hangzhouensis]|nr:efflux RND transporter periplasmic adaptor subunit [Vibrio hangzhouensis]
MNMVRKRILTNASIAAIFLALTGCKESRLDEASVTKPLTVSTTEINLSPYYTVKREYVGTVKAGQQANLGFELAGKIESLLVDVGDQVAKGTPLIQLDTDLLVTEANQLRAQTNEVKAQLKLVDANLQRQQSLKTKGFSADAEIDALTSEKGVLQANLLRLKAALNANKLRQDKSTLVAPYAGVIAKRHVSLGDVVNVGTPTLELLASEGKEAFIGIPAHQLSRVTHLKAPQVRVADHRYAVKLLNPGAMVDTQSRSVGLRYRFPEEAQLLEGQLAYLAFDEQVNESGYWVPLTALIDGLRGVWNVYIIDTNNIVERRTVNVLYADSQRAFVNGAIQDGESIISSGLHRVVPGQNVLVAGK